MENRRTEKNAWMAVPQFGGWDQKTSRTDYSMVFQRARAKRKQNKIDVHRPSSLGNEEDLIRRDHHVPSPSVKKKLLKYLSCCKG